MTFFAKPLPVTVTPSRWRKEPSIAAWDPALRINQGSTGITLLLTEMDAFITECEAVEAMFYQQEDNR